MNQTKQIDNLRVHTRAGTLSLQASPRLRPAAPIATLNTDLQLLRVHIQLPSDETDTADLWSMLLAKAHSAFYPIAVEATSHFH
jgi:hypothetical protein